MFKRFLVPLDGSQLAESILPAVFSLAGCFHGEVLLFHAIEQDARTKVHGERHLSDPNEAKTYLSQVAMRFERPGVLIDSHVHTVRQADVARSVIEHIAEYQVDLVALCAHGRRDLRDAIIGNIAQQVIARGSTPVLFIRPEKSGSARVLRDKFHTIVLPLDGTPQHEPALPIAEEITRMCGANLHLVTVVPTMGTLSAERAGTGMLLPATMAEVLELAQRGAVEYLQDTIKKISVKGVQVTAEVARGDTAPAILDASKRAGADMIVLATHGRTTLDAFWSGSVTPKVLSAATVPVLLIRVVGEESQR